MNASMSWMLKTPGLQRLVGKGTALLTFSGSKSGDKITMPISYVEVDDQILVSGYRSRMWWRSLLTHPEVELRLAGRVRHGMAMVMDDPDNAFADFMTLLLARPMVAKINDIPIEDGRPNEGKAREVLTYTVVVSIKLEEVR